VVLPNLCCPKESKVQPDAFLVTIMRRHFQAHATPAALLEARGSAGGLATPPHAKIGVGAPLSSRLVEPDWCDPLHAALSAWERSLFRPLMEPVGLWETGGRRTGRLAA